MKAIQFVFQNGIESPLIATGDSQALEISTVAIQDKTVKSLHFAGNSRAPRVVKFIYQDSESVIFETKGTKP